MALIIATRFLESSQHRLLYKEIRDINVYKDLEMLKVKVPIEFLGAWGWTVPSLL